MTDLILQKRLVRQHLIKPAGIAEYDRLFRLMQPTFPEYWTRPGNPPVLTQRADFDEEGYNFERRADRQLIKGRFQNGNLGYVHEDELEAFACAYRRPVRLWGQNEEVLYRILEREGPVTIHVLKDMTGLKAKTITPVLHKFQKAFQVFEDQVDNEWDRGWYLFEKEFPDVNLEKHTPAQALALWIPRFLRLMIFATREQIHDFYCLSKRSTETALQLLQDSEQIEPVRMGDADGYMLPEDRNLLQNADPDSPSSVFVLQRNDFLVRAHASELARRFSGGGDEIIYHILVDGRFQGVVTGRFRYQENDLNNIHLDLPAEECMDRKLEVLAALDRISLGHAGDLKRYCGEPA